jgi:hypothetical protein
MVFAVATAHTVLLYDTEQACAFAVAKDIHYASITDLSWAPDGLYGHYFEPPFFVFSFLKHFDTF